VLNHGGLKARVRCLAVWRAPARSGTVRWAATLALALAMPLGAAEKACSDGSLEGAYGFRLTGTNTALNRLFAIVGRISFDGAGALKVNATQSFQGKVMRVPLEGKYTVRADCSGTAKLAAPDGSAVSLDFVIVNGGRGIEFISADDGTVESGSATKLSPDTSQQVRR